MTIDTLLFQFWGKTSKAGDSPSQFHPAIYHMLDVACVAEALLRDGTPRLRQAMLTAWRGCNPDLLLHWLPFLIATHDLGKIAAAFQGQVELQRERLLKVGVRFNTRSVQLYHAEISALWLHQELATHEPGVARTTLMTLRDAMGGHHGRFAEAEMADIRKRLQSSEQGEPRWVSWRTQTYALLRALLAPAHDLSLLGAPLAIRPATAALTGFIVWCDWMGSNEQDFPATPGLDVTTYLSVARDRAQQALDLHQMRAVRPIPRYAGFHALFPDQPAPRPLQGVIDQLSVEGMDVPTLTIIEAPTGEGKTEATLALARRIAAARGVDELFFALPTMATGNQMFLRLQRFFGQLYAGDGAVRLTHSQALVIEDDLRRRVQLAGDQDRDDRDGRSADAALEWFVGSKKAMLAPFGVGTVDQLELSGLNVRHYPLRLFGLAGKVVVIDEIHAYDAYMSTIIDHTLTWLATLGCSVILLSATLPQARHRALAQAFVRGQDPTMLPEPPQQLPYPVLASYRAGFQQQISYAVFRGVQHCTLRIGNQRSAEADAAYLLDLVRDGGAVARLCNRVDDAQAIYEALMRRMPETGQRALLHARFPLTERKRGEQWVEMKLGKQTTRTPTEPLIVIGTQVLEQSLDYDVDVMVSDFAPLDLLLQRAGRLHRHDRHGKRPACHQNPVLEVVAPVDAQGVPDWRRWAPIYEPYILWRSWAALDARTIDGQCIIELPRDYRLLIEAVYGNEPVTSGRFADHITERFAAYTKIVKEQESQARRPLTPSALGQDPITAHGGYTFVDDESGQMASWQLAKTRLGDRVTLVPIYHRDHDGYGGHQLCLDAGGTFRISADTPPDIELQKDILNHAVPVSDRRLIAAYRNERRDRRLRWPWSEVPSTLRSLSPLPLDPTTHSTTINGSMLRLDRNLGLVITRGDQAIRPDIFDFEEEL